MDKKMREPRQPPKEATTKPIQLSDSGLSVSAAYVVPVGDLRVTQDGVASVICDVYANKEAYDSGLTALYSSAIELPPDDLFKSAVSLANKLL